MKTTSTGTILIFIALLLLGFAVSNASYEISGALKKIATAVEKK